MNPNYQNKGDEIQIIIHKPVYGTFVYIRKAYIEEAMKQVIPLHIIIDNIGEAYLSGESWLDGSQMIEKEFLIPGKPMKLYGNHLSKFIDKAD